MSKKLIQANLNYIGPGRITEEELFEELHRVHYITKILRRYKNTGKINSRLLINHIILLYNQFDSTYISILFKETIKDKALEILLNTVLVAIYKSLLTTDIDKDFLKIIKEDLGEIND